MAKKNNGKLAVRILAWVLCIMMVVSLAYTAIYLIIANTQKDDKDDEKKSAQVELVLPDNI
jgi:hypothetical protein